MNEAEKIKIIADHYGYDAQSRQCIEEMAEIRRIHQTERQEYIQGNAWK